jgi:hypothetical protein
MRSEWPTHGHTCFPSWTLRRLNADPSRIMIGTQLALQ